MIAPRGRQRDLLHAPHRLEAPLLIERARRGVVAVQVTKESFEFRNFFVTNVVPHLKDRAMRPEVALRPSVAPETRANAPARCHAHVDHLKALSFGTTPRNAVVQNVDASQVRWQSGNVVDGHVLETTADQSKGALWQG